MVEKTIALVILNPTIDFCLSNPVTLWHGKESFCFSGVAVGGGGINVARGLSAIGKHATVYTLAHGRLGGLMCNLLTSEGIKFRTSVGDQEPRIVSITYGAQAKMFVGPSPQISQGAVERFLKEWYDEIRSHSIVLISGSVPETAARPIVAGLVHPLLQAGIKVILDTRDQLADLSIKEVPFALRYNKSGRTKVVLKHLEELHLSGVPYILYSNYKKEKVYALFLRQLWCFTQPVAQHRIFGRGDAFMAGVISGILDNLSMCEITAFGIACAMAYDKLFPQGLIANNRLSGHLALITSHMCKQL